MLERIAEDSVLRFCQEGAGGTLMRILALPPAPSGIFAQKKYIYTVESSTLTAAWSIINGVGNTGTAVRCNGSYGIQYDFSLRSI